MGVLRRPPCLVDRVYPATPDRGVAGLPHARRATTAALAAMLVLAAVLGLKAASLASAAGLHLVVNDTSDRVDSNPGNGECRTSVGTCTLRAAIQETNARPGADVIQLPGGTYEI